MSEKKRSGSGESEKDSRAKEGRPVTLEEKSDAKE